MNETSKSLFQRVLGDEAWYRLAPAVRRHYDLRSPGGEPLLLKGVMDEIFQAPVIRPWLLIARWFEALVSIPGKAVPTDVRNWIETAQPDALRWHRTFAFPEGRNIVFASRMEAGRPGEVIEYLRFGVGIRMAVSERDGALVYTGLEHCWKLPGFILGIPNWLLLGTAVIVEQADSENSVHLDFEIRHPWLGRTFGYRGRFDLPADMRDA